MIEPGSVLVKAGISSSGPLIGLIMRQLEDGEREQIRKSFAQALAWKLASEGERAVASKGGVLRAGRGPKSKLTRLGRKVQGAWPKAGKRKAQADQEQRNRGAIARGAADLTKAWTESPPPVAAGHGEAGETWIVKLGACVEKTARSGAVVSSSGCAEWSYLVTGTWDQKPTDSEIREWSGFVATQVVRLWREKPKLARVVAQLNAESGMGLQQALLLASKEISRNLRWIAFSATSLVVLGGGGISLLVLFLDKG